MRSLNTSLPGTSPPKSAAPEQPEQLLQAFKAAALSVTKLYKTAAQDQTRARTEGYQDALDDLLIFLDKESLGLSDGEGWRIRRWATERLDGRDPGQNQDSEDEAEKIERASSPVLQRAQSVTRAPTRSASPVRTESAPPMIPATITETPDLPPPSGPFTFRSSYAYPQDADMELADLELSDNGRGQSHEPSGNSSNAGSASSAIGISRPPRLANRHAAQSGRLSSRSSASIGRGAGQKRKINISDFFDISNLGPHTRDSHGGGGKRGRFL